MSTLILRPTPPGGDRYRRPWRLQGSWGTRELPPMSAVDLYGRLHDELVASDLLPADAPRPSNRYHDHVTRLMGECSCVGGRWVRDSESSQPAAT
jgi:hypothetical protein